MNDQIKKNTVRLAGAMAALCMATVTNVAQAVPVSLDLEYTCTYPLIGAQPLSVNIRSDMPVEIPVGQSTGAFDIDVIATARGLTWTGLNLVQATSIEGVANAASNLSGTNLSLDLVVPATIPNQPVPPVDGDFDLLASGQTPPLTFSANNIGDIVITVNNLDMSLLARKSDGSPVFFAESDPDTGVFPTPCILNPNQDNILHTFAVVDTGPPPAPALSVSPASLVLPDTVLGASNDTTLSIGNTGGADLLIDEISVAGSAANEFFLSHACNSISPGTSCPVTVTFTPADTGNRLATLNILSNDVSSPATIPLAGEGVMAPEADIRLSASTLDFGTVAPGVPVQRQLTVHNDGGAALSINGMVALSGTNSSDYSINNNCTIVDPGQSCLVTITFTPQDEGMRTATLTISSNDPDTANSTVALNGLGQVVAVAMITVTPAQLAFADTALGLSNSRTLTIGNAGNASLMVLSAQITGSNSSDFSQTGSCSDIPAGDSCVLTITFSPEAEGARNAQLTISSTDNASPVVTVPLNGLGTPLPAPMLTITPQNLAFGNVRLGESLDRTITLTNDGAAELLISNISISGNSDFSLAPHSCAALAPDASCAVTVSFSPGALGGASASLTIESNSNASPSVVSITANGVNAAQPDAAVSPNPVNFGTVLLGSSKTEPMLLANFLGSAALAVSVITLENNQDNAFSLLQSCPNTIGVQGSCGFSLIFTPSAAISSTATLVVLSNDPDTPRIEVPISGRGASAAGADIALSANAIEFADTLVNAATNAQLTITNTGNEMLSVTGTLGGVDAAQFSFSTDGSCNAIAPGASCVISSTFAPDNPGAQQALLTLNSNAVNQGSISIALSGTAIEPPTAALSVSSDLLDLGEVLEGASNNGSVTLTNSGNAVLTVSATIVGVDASAFTLNGNCNSVAAGSNCQLGVAFTPQRTGMHDATLVLSSNADQQPVREIALAGVGLATPEPVVSVAPMAQNFGMVTVGDNATANVTVRNLGNANLLISGISVTGAAANDFSFTDNCSTLSAGLQCSINMTFTPSAVGLRDASLRVATNDAQNPIIIVSLSGQGEALPVPQLELASASVDFPATEIGGTSDAAVIIRNTGTATLSISDVELTDNTVFAVLNSCTDIAPAADCTLKLRFTPTQSGVAATDLTVRSNDSASPHLITLSGNGVAAPVSLINSSSNAIAFGSVLLGESSPRTITIDSVGGATLNVSDITIFGSGASQFLVLQSCVGALAVNQRCSLVVAFAPSDASDASATLRITSDADNSALLDIPLTGTGQPQPIAELSSDRQQLIFGTIAPGNVASDSVLLTNTGTLPVTLAFRVSGTNADAFFPFDGGTCRSLAPGASCQLGVSFSAASGEALVATLEIVSSAGTLAVSLSGSVSNAADDDNGSAGGENQNASTPGSSSGSIGAFPLPLLMAGLLLFLRRRAYRVAC